MVNKNYLHKERSVGSQAAENEKVLQIQIGSGIKNTYFHPDMSYSGKLQCKFYFSYVIF